MYSFLVYFLPIWLVSASPVNNLNDDIFSITPNPDFGLDIFGFMKKYGYPLENHTVTTEDGYILTMHRIPHGKRNSETLDTPVKPVALLQHGLGSSSVDWINKGPDQSLGQLLADAGWDVWLGNNRGTLWSRSHLKLNPDKDKKYWDFSFDECGYYDIPAMIDYIVAKTGNEKVYFVGHSQGTTEFFAMASRRPEYNDKIALMVALAPVAYMNHIRSPMIEFAGKHIEEMQNMCNVLGITHIDHSLKLANMLKDWCSDGSKFQDLCAKFMCDVGGNNPEELDKTFLPVLFYNMPAGMSMKMMMHYGQEPRSGTFQRFDYGPIENVFKYGTPNPPRFNLSAISAPVALYYSENDLFVGIEDMEHLASELQNVQTKHLMEDKLWTHLDFLWAKDLKTRLNGELVHYMTSFVKKENQLH